MAIPSAVNANGGELRLRIRSTGKLAILTDDDRDVTPRGRKPRAILAYLASKAERRASRETLMDLLWGDRGEAQARASLRQALLEIRHATGDVVRADREHVWIDAAATIVESEADTSESFADLNHITPEFDDWLRRERERRSGEALRDLRHQIEQLLARGRGPAAAALIERMRTIDPYNEHCLRLAMQADFQAGQPAAIEKRFKETEQLLKRDLGVAPAAETRALRDRLIAELTRVPEQLPKEETGAALPPPVASARRLWRRKWVAAASVAAIAASGGLLYNAASAPAAPPRLAVLPFAAGSGVDPALAEGLSDELHGQLARNGQIRVIGRTSAAQFKGKTTDLRDVGRKLDARYIVEGTVRQRDGRVNIFVSLVRAKDGSALWSRNFSGAANRLEAVETAIGGEIGRSLGATTLSVAKPPTNGEAYALYIRAKALIRNRDFESGTKALELLRQANRIDPNFASVWAQLAALSFLIGENDVELSDGTRVSKREAAARALKLDPNLAEAHAIAWLVEGGGNASTKTTRAHLRRALELDPNDPQALYWWSGVLRAAGDYPKSAKIARQVAEMDPLWQRPVAAAIEASLDAGDRAGALNYLRTIKAGNPKGAREVEVAMALYEADYSRAVQLAFSDRGEGWDAGKGVAVRALIGLDFVREAFLIDPFLRPFDRVMLTGRAPPLPRIRSGLQAAHRDDDATYSMIIWKLAQEKRWPDVAALYEDNLGTMQDVRGTDSGGRTMRVAFAPMLALSLHKAGRKAEAVRLALASDAAAKAILANGQMPAPELVAIAGSEAILGRRDNALAHLEQAFAKGWRMDTDLYSRLNDNPVFATLRGHPRFERLRRIQEAHFAKERREVLALGIL